MLQQSPDAIETPGEEIWAPVVAGRIFGLSEVARLGKAETLPELKAYYRRLADALSLHQGTLEQVTGHEWVARFSGEPEKALWGAETLFQMLLSLQDERSVKGLPPLRTGIGLHLGGLIGGMVTTAERIEPVLVGEGVRVAGRLAETCRDFRTGILVSGDLVAALEDPTRFDLRSLGMLRLGPGDKRIGVYELFSTREEPIRNRMREMREDWNAAIRLFRLGQWEACAKALRAYLAHVPQDRAARRILRMCRLRESR